MASFSNAHLRSRADTSSPASPTNGTGRRVTAPDHQGDDCTVTYQDPYGQRSIPAPFPVPVVPQKSAGVAVALELVFGLLGIFGVGNLYAGRTGIGLALMFSFWGLFWVDVLLIFVFVGFVTMPLTWVAYLVAGPVLAAKAVEYHNALSGTQPMIGPAF